MEGWPWIGNRRLKVASLAFFRYISLVYFVIASIGEWWAGRLRLSFLLLLDHGRTALRSQLISRGGISQRKGKRRVERE